MIAPSPQPESPAEYAARHARRWGRPNRPLRAVAGALLVVSAVVAALAMYTNAGDRTEVLAVGRTVLAGERIADADLRVVSVAADGVVPIAAADRGEVVGRSARVRIVAGSLLVDSALSDDPLVSPSSAVMAIELPAVNVPVGLRERSPVLLIAVPARTAMTGEPVAPLLVDAIVAAVPHDLAELAGFGGAATVSLSVEVAPEYVAALGAAESLAIAVREPVGAPAATEARS